MHKKYLWLFRQNFFNSKQILQCLIQMLQTLMLGFEFCWNMLHFSSKTGQLFSLRVAPFETFLSFLRLRNGVYTFFWLKIPSKAPLVVAWNGVPKIFHKKGVFVLLLLPWHNFWKSVGCNVWSTFFSHPNSQNNGGATQHIALKFSK